MMDYQVEFFIYEDNLNAVEFFRILADVVEPLLDELPFVSVFNHWFQMNGVPGHILKKIDNELSQIFLVEMRDHSVGYLDLPILHHLIFIYGVKNHIRKQKQFQIQIYEIFSSLGIMKIKRQRIIMIIIVY